MKRILATFAFISAVSACGPSPVAEKPVEAPKKPVIEEPKLVGRIASIPADKRFVLIQSYGKWEIGTDQILTTSGPSKRAANLKTTGEKLGEFAAADIQSGSAEIGDAVYSQPIPKPNVPLETPQVPPPQTDKPAIDL